MAQKDLLTIIQNTQAELGLPQDTEVIDSTQPTTVQMLAYANAEVEELRQCHNWTALQSEYNLVVSPPTDTTGDTTENSPIITNIPSTTGITAGYFYVAGDNVPVGARVLSVDSATQVTLTMEVTATEVGASLQFAQDTYPLPADFDHYINRTWWDRTNRWELLGPDSPQVRQWHLSGIVTTGPRRHFSQLGALANNYRIWPPPAEITEPLQLVFEYISFNSIYVNGVVADSLSNAKYFANDADIPVLNDRAIIMGIKWRFWEQKGFDWVSKRTDYDNYVERLKARDGGAKTLDLAGYPRSMLIDSDMVQDGYFPGATGPNMS